MIKKNGDTIKFSKQATFIFETMKQYPNYRIFETHVRHKNRLTYELAEIDENHPHAYNYYRIKGRFIIHKNTVWFLIENGLLEETIAWANSNTPRKCYKLNKNKVDCLEKQGE